ncbi:putative redox protein [Candidatus Kryptobacter tengchongensis]|uniref:OsmC family protein n=1 Tax=Kryptobacter tengchongensis TaxID=1643429 RepID=UPI0007082D1F|nr:OsmC family protein [Candidatus Kryptobacter tengchongensis]CUS88185.1 putative redox protein [Candidatus Kryptobacter tengchongensis]CUU09922.1 putative redox protein [Candidatus Kryptobacter tengchongensis]
MPKVEVKFVDGMTFIGKGESNHWVVMDGAETVGGSDAGTRPMELVLIALGGCTGMDVVSILRKKRVKFDKFEMKISGERAEEHPKVYTKIDIEYIIYGKEINPKDVEHAIELSQSKYCSVSAMLKKSGAQVNYSYKIIQPETEVVKGE